MRDYLQRLYTNDVAPNHIWCGVSVKDSTAAKRIEHLKSTPAAIWFFSIEPLPCPVGSIDLTGISQVIVGGETGSKARPMQPEWIRSVRDLCIKADGPLLFK